MRVQKGIVGTDEQVGYMEKLLGAHKTLIQSEADMTSARLAIVGRCEESKRTYLNNWLKKWQLYLSLTRSYSMSLKKKRMADTFESKDRRHRINWKRKVGEKIYKNQRKRY